MSAKKNISLLALAASFRSDSHNRLLLDIAVRQAEKHGARVTMLDYQSCDCPLFKDENHLPLHLPAGAKLLADALLAHDGLLLATPEYNWSIPASLKNLIDWLSVDERAPFSGKAALLLSASPSIRGGITGLMQLRVPLEVLHVWVYPQLISVGKAHETIKAGELLAEKEYDFLVTHVAQFVQAARQLSDITRHAP